MRWTLAFVTILASCGPSTGNNGNNEPCGPQDVEGRGILVGLDERECSPCPRNASFVSITLETTCEAGVEWEGPSCLIRRTTATNIATSAQFAFDEGPCPRDNRLWRVAPDQPLQQLGRRLDEFIEEPADDSLANYSLTVELRFELADITFDASVE
ncbi:MAG: hypothetical protein AAGF11_54510 [Myxococcota bacterium]